MAESQSTRNSNLSRRGGKRPGAGRRPYAIQDAANRIFSKFKLLDVAKGIAVGDIWEDFANSKGEVVSGPTRNADRLAAIRFIADYAFGKPKQAVEHSGPDGAAIAVTVTRRIVASGEGA